MLSVVEECKAETDDEIRALFAMRVDEWRPEYDEPGGLVDRVYTRRKWLFCGDRALFPITRWRNTRCES